MIHEFQLVPNGVPAVAGPLLYRLTTKANIPNPDPHTVSVGLEELVSGATILRGTWKRRGFTDAWQVSMAATIAPPAAGTFNAPKQNPIVFWEQLLHDQWRTPKGRPRTTAVYRLEILRPYLIGAFVSTDALEAVRAEARLEKARREDVLNSIYGLWKHHKGVQ